MGRLGGMGVNKGRGARRYREGEWGKGDRGVRRVRNVPANEGNTRSPEGVGEGKGRKKGRKGGTRRSRAAAVPPGEGVGGGGKRTRGARAS